jgi:hypothetical protein
MVGSADFFRSAGEDEEKLSKDPHKLMLARLDYERKERIRLAVS